MGVLKPAFDSITRLHSRAAVLKRFGTPDLTSDIRITPSNYFRNIEGPSHTIVRGREFIIPVDAIYGTPVQEINFSAVPSTGSFLLTYDGTDTAVFDETVVAASIQTELRLITGLEFVTVSGSLASQKLTVVFSGVQSPVLLESTLTLGDELDATISIVKRSKGEPWPNGMLKRGDKIIDPVFGSLAVDEIVEMTDLGGEVMGLRCRCE